MRILITNDDGYKAEGLIALVETLRPFGEITVVAPKYHQSGMSMAVSMGLKPIAAKKISEEGSEQWWYVDATPSSCVKYAFDEIYFPHLPDIVVSGINHGANAASAALYSATVGAAEEAALAGVPAIAVSLDNFSRHADFSSVQQLFPEIFRDLTKNMTKKFGTFYNINFPDLPASEIKGTRLCHQGIIHWEKEFRPYDYDVFEKMGITPLDMGILKMPEAEEGEKIYVMAGDQTDDRRNIAPSDHRALAGGYISIVPHNIDFTDYEELSRLRKLDIFEKQ